MRPNLDLSSVPTGVLVILGVVVVLEVALAVFALVNLVRRPREAVSFGNKWIWVAFIVLVNLIGPIVSLAVGRNPAMAAPDTSPVASTGATSTGVTAASVADSL